MQKQSNHMTEEGLNRLFIIWLAAGQVVTDLHESSAEVLDYLFSQTTDWDKMITNWAETEPAASIPWGPGSPISLGSQEVYHQLSSFRLGVRLCVHVRLSLCLSVYVSSWVSKAGLLAGFLSFCLVPPESYVHHSQLLTTFINRFH